MKRAFWLFVGLGLAVFALNTEAATCAQTNVEGFIYLTTQSLAECGGYVLMDSSEYSQVPTLQALFAWPESDQVIAAWMAGFTLPMLCYFVAWGFGTVVNFFKPETERY